MVSSYLCLSIFISSSSFSFHALPVFVVDIEGLSRARTDLLRRDNHRPLLKEPRPGGISFSRTDGQGSMVRRSKFLLIQAPSSPRPAKNGHTPVYVEYFFFLIWNLCFVEASRVSENSVISFSSTPSVRISSRKKKSVEENSIIRLQEAKLSPKKETSSIAIVLIGGHN